MPFLKSETQTIIKVNYYELDKFIQEVTGHTKYSCVASEEWNNDSSHPFSVDGNLTDYDQDEWLKFKEGKSSGTFKLWIILNGLCADKHISPGNYLISVCW